MTETPETREALEERVRDLTAGIDRLTLLQMQATQRAAEMRRAASVLEAEASACEGEARARAVRAAEMERERTAARLALTFYEVPP